LLAAIVGLYLSVLLLLACSFLALREHLALTHQVRPASLKSLAYFLIAASYLLILLDLPQLFVAFLPVAALLALAITSVFTRGPEGFAMSVPSLYWGVLLTGYAPAFAALLFTLPPEMNPIAGGAGWFLLLLLLTEANDISQALIGRRLGVRQLAPQTSPYKTWAGFAGGVCVTILLAAVLAQWLTPWRPLIAVAAGLVVSLAGVLGDLNLSALKRNCQVKDSGTLLPGQGGMLDRIDSLTFTAPVFYGFVLIVDSISHLAATEIS